MKFKLDLNYDDKKIILLSRLLVLFITLIYSSLYNWKTLNFPINQNLDSDLYFYLIYVEVLLITSLWGILVSFFWKTRDIKLASITKSEESRRLHHFLYGLFLYYCCVFFAIIFPNNDFLNVYFASFTINTIGACTFTYGITRLLYVRHELENTIGLFLDPFILGTISMTSQDLSQNIFFFTISIILLIPNLFRLLVNVSRGNSLAS